MSTQREYTNRLRQLGERLKGRLGPEVVDDALEYIDHWETPLAIRVLADQMCEFAIKVERDEYNELLLLSHHLGADEDYANHIAAVENLVSSEDQ